jgi:hypothetical protein
VIRAACFSLTLICAPVVALADAALERLYDLIEVDAYNQILRDEGLKGADDLAWDMLGRGADGALMTQIGKIYDLDRLGETARIALRNGMTDEQIDYAVAFFESAEAQKVVQLEVAARRAMSDSTIEDAAKEAWYEAEESKPWMVARINEIIEINDWIERNVAGGLNSNLQFFKGLADGDGLTMSEAEMLSEVWSQEDEVRLETADWLGAYLLLAYDPLTELELKSYTTFWQTDAGQALNAALFDGFDAAYDEISYATGRVIALSMGTQEL